MNSEEAARDYAEDHAGRLMDFQPISTTQRFPVRVVGHYYTAILVQPVDTADVPPQLVGILDLPTVYPSAGYTWTATGRVMVVALAQLYRPVPRDPHRPHRCPRCGKAAYVGVVPAAVDCSSWECPSKK